MQQHTEMPENKRKELEQARALLQKQLAERMAALKNHGRAGDWLWRWRWTREPDAGTKLVESFKGLVRSVTNKFYFKSWTEEDFYQEGLIALVKTADTFHFHEKYPYYEFLPYRVAIHCGIKLRNLTAEKRNTKHEISFDADSAVPKAVRRIQSPDNNPEAELLAKDAPGTILKILEKANLSKLEKLVIGHAIDPEIAGLSWKGGGYIAKIARRINEMPADKRPIDSGEMTPKKVENARTRASRKLRAAREHGQI